MFDEVYLYDVEGEKWVPAPEGEYRSAPAEALDWGLILFEHQQEMGNLLYMYCPEHHGIELVDRVEEDDVFSKAGCQLQGWPVLVKIDRGMVSEARLAVGVRHKYIVPLRWHLRLDDTSNEVRIKVEAVRLEIQGRYGRVKHFSHGIKINIIERYWKNMDAVVEEFKERSLETMPPIVADTVIAFMQQNLQKEQGLKAYALCGGTGIGRLRAFYYNPSDMGLYFLRDIMKQHPEPIDREGENALTQRYRNLKVEIFQTKIRRNMKYKSAGWKEADNEVKRLGEERKSILTNIGVAKISYCDKYIWQKENSFLLVCEVFGIKNPPLALLGAYYLNPYAVTVYKIFSDWQITDVHLMLPFMEQGSSFKYFSLDNFILDSQGGLRYDDACDVSQLWYRISFYSKWLVSSIGQELFMQRFKAFMESTWRSSMLLILRYFFTEWQRLSDETMRQLAWYGFSQENYHRVISDVVESIAQEFAEDHLTIFATCQDLDYELDGYTFCLVKYGDQFVRAGYPAFYEILNPYAPEWDRLNFVVVMKDEAYVGWLELTEWKRVMRCRLFAGDEQNDDLLAACEKWAEDKKVCLYRGGYYAIERMQLGKAKIKSIV